MKKLFIIMILLLTGCTSNLVKEEVNPNKENHIVFAQIKDENGEIVEVQVIKYSYHGDMIKIITFDDEEYYVKSSDVIITED